MVNNINNQLSLQKKEDGYYLESCALSSDSIDTFFLAFKKIVSFYINEDLSKCASFSCQKLTSALIRTRAKHPKFFSSIYDTFLKSSALNLLIHHNSLENIAARFLNCSSDVLYTHGVMLRMDPPNDARNRLDWHQDSAYDQINSVPTNGVILWCPLVDTNISNGTWIVCPKSHQEPNHIFKVTQGTPGVTRKITTPDNIVSKYEQKSIAANAGDCVAAYGNLIHKSGTNSSENIRFTLLVRFNEITKKDFYLCRSHT